MSFNFNEYDSSGPRPPIPGEETARKYKVNFMRNSKNFATKSYFKINHVKQMTDTFLASSSSSSSHSTNATPPCLQWARTLSNLLEDREGNYKCLALH
jgi:hypothetical protein